MLKYKCWHAASKLREARGKPWISKPEMNYHVSCVKCTSKRFKPFVFWKSLFLKDVQRGKRNYFKAKLKIIMFKKTRVWFNLWCHGAVPIKWTYYRVRQDLLCSLLLQCCIKFTDLSDIFPVSPNTIELELRLFMSSIVENYNGICTKFAQIFITRKRST